MKNKLIGIFLTFSVIFALLPFCRMNVFAIENYSRGFDGNTDISGIVDGSGLLESDELETLDSVVKTYSDKLKMNILIYISDSYMSDSDTEIFCDDSYDSTYGEDTDGVFYYIDNSGKIPAYDYISTSGKAVLMYEDYKEDIFSYLDNFLPPSGTAMTNENLDGAIMGFLNRLEYYYDDSSQSKDYYYDESSGKYFYYDSGNLIIAKTKPSQLVRRQIIFSFIVSAIIGIIVAVCTYFIIKSHYKFKKGQSSGVYLSTEKSGFSVREDRYLRSHVSKHKIESSSGGSHGGSHHSHSGGHGGGGHHR